MEHLLGVIDQPANEVKASKREGNRERGLSEPPTRSPSDPSSLESTIPPSPMAKPVQ